MSKLHAERNSMLMVLIALCTVTIIWTNYIFAQQIVTNINEDLMENEYKKIWGKENYLILQEIQRKEIIWYIDNIKKEKPELIEEILKKEISENGYKLLNNDIINDLKKDAYILWNTWSLVTIIEFSDMECPYCIKQHTEWTIKDLLKNNSDKVNYLFKNFPLPAHKNAQIEAEAAKCVEKVAWWKKYFEFLDWVYSSTQGGWEWYDVKKLTTLSQKLWINKTKFNTCISKYETKEAVEREFMQWRMLWIESIPATLILNNETWEYSIITQEADFEDIDELIRDISK